VHIIKTHFGLGRGERLLQAQLLNDELLATGPTDMPLILLGDFNSLPGSRTHRALGKHLRDTRKLVAPVRAFRTFPTSFPAFAVDHIFVNTALHPLGLDVHRSPRARVASDHYPLVAELARA
jgi:endonuclease/exonuclease/phosphatase family metal-dependent hydrolase